MPTRPLRLFALLTAACLTPGWAAAQSVISFTIVNADTGADIATLPVVSAATPVVGTVQLGNTPRINIRANAVATRSVVFIDGSGATRTENSAPFAYKGNSGSSYTKWSPAAGVHTILATPWTKFGTVRQAGPQATLQLTAVSTVTPPPAVADRPRSRNEAARFLAQATFGPTARDIDSLMTDGYRAWFNKQFSMPPDGSHEDFFVRMRQATGRGNDKEVVAAFWKQAVQGPDQLRLRMAWALSQIFVISLQDGDVDNHDQAVARWQDMLAAHSFGNYRQLLEAVALNPLMGIYLSHLGNQKADARTGRVPDENFAREVMQLFSIGLVALRPDGSTIQDNGRDRETYAPADVSELAKVFTGWSWDCSTAHDRACFLRGGSPDTVLKPLVPYADFHSAEAKTFLNITIPANTDARRSLQLALDRLAAHPNAGPFIGRLLIQRFTTSQPSPAYVKAVADRFNDNGAGVRGDLKAVLQAVLMHPEARPDRPGNRAGKVREPVLRLTALLRAFPHRSTSGWYDMALTDSPATGLAQAPLHSPSVFNFYRPGYRAPMSSSATAGMDAPELQLVNETSVAGYVNFMRDSIAWGVGRGAGDNLRQGGRDLVATHEDLLPMAIDPDALVNEVADRLTYGAMSAARRGEIIAVVTNLPLAAAAARPDQITAALRKRVHAAILLTVSTPEFIVLK